jgi:hypothetical protein
VIREKHVDVKGVAIPNKADTFSFPVAGTDYSKDITPITGYSVKGYKEGPTPPNGNGTYTTGATAYIKPVTKSTTMFFVYGLYVETTVTITKTITGSLADMKKKFAFTVYFTDASGKELDQNTKFVFTGGTIEGMTGITAPDGGTLTLDFEGKDSFTLGHGQAITIKGVPSDVKINIKETPDKYYAASYTDRLDGSGEDLNYTDFITVGDDVRRFDFVNDRIEIVPTGVCTGFCVPFAILFAIMLLLAASAIVIGYMRRQKCER